MTSIPYIPTYEAPETYLNASWKVRSWLLTVDHKRIAILYMVSITLFFFVGGAAATIMRVNLLDPHRAGSSKQKPTTSCSPSTA